MADIARCEQENTNWCWAACIQAVLASKGITKSQQEIVDTAIEACFPDPSELTNNNIQMPLDSIAAAFNANGLPAVFHGMTPLPEEVMEYLDADWRCICFSGQADGHVVLVTGLAGGSADDPVLVIVDPKPGREEVLEASYSDLRVGADFNAGGWQGTVVAR
jgi:hypothetical protein